MADAIGAVADNVSQQLVCDSTSAASSLSEGLRQARVEPSGSLVRKTIDEKLDRGAEKGRPSMDRGFEESQPGMDRRVEESLLIMDRGFEERRPSDDRGVEERRPSMDRRVKELRPRLDRDVKERRPSMDQGIEERQPSMDLEFEQRQPSMNRGFEERRPSMDRGVEHNGWEHILGLKAAAGDNATEDRPSLVVEHANTDGDATLNHKIVPLLQPSTARSDYTSYKDDFTAMSDNHATRSITTSRSVELFSIVFVYLYWFLSGSPDSR